MWMCDTGVMVEVMSRRPQASVIAWLRAQKRIALSALTVEEVLFHLESRELQAQAQWFEKFMEQHCEVLEVSGAIAKRAGSLRARMKKLGATASQGELLIAATAVEHALPLATKNTQSMSRCGVAVMNPFEELA
jgi:predicted nucleic acid-binding protein